MRMAFLMQRIEDESVQEQILKLVLCVLGGLCGSKGKTFYG
jgi:hypothetical protein